ncbi:hypothetical protein CTEN210_12790 [Chaetoceros tenuissimus]|uniref:HSF-type DNA-binding domain-containing protein n=1 Tax=Chaetoceros tenuissimus TaxID=426638 RepID=A0AAD3HAU2_9STRA|nr:hypothetical protein CTEN210_12790 [Chaetoceros tenuissimus]
MIFDYSDIQPIHYPCRLEGEDTKDGGSNNKLNFTSIENENSDTSVNYFTPSKVIENESPLEKMLTTLTGKTKCQRSTKDKAVKFPLKLMYVWTCGDYDHLVHWKVNQVDGSDVFVINDIDGFTNEVLPSLFKVAKFVSFQRKMYRWGILKSHRSRSDKKKGIVSYSHPFFKKGDFFLAAQMICSGTEVETQKTASKQKKKVQRQELRSKSDSKQARGVSKVSRSINTRSKDDLEDLTLSVYSPEDGLMTSMRVSSILNHTTKQHFHLNRLIDEEKTSMPPLSKQMGYTQAPHAVAKSFLEPMPNMTSNYPFSMQGNPNFLPLDRMQETQEELYGPMKYDRRDSSNDVRHFIDSFEFGVPAVNTSDQLLGKAFSDLRKRNVFEW